MGKWLAGLASALIAGLLVVLIAGQWRPWNGEEEEDDRGGQASPPEVQTPAAAIEGEWSLVSWREAPSDVTLGMEPTSGSLEASSEGSMTWTLDIDDLYWDDSGAPQAAVTCEGQIDLDSRVSGAVAITADYTSNMESVRDWIAEAFCGGGVGVAYLPFAANYAPESDATTLEMENEWGTFTWQR